MPAERAREEIHVGRFDRAFPGCPKRETHLATYLMLRDKKMSHEGAVKYVQKAMATERYGEAVSVVMPETDWPEIKGKARYYQTAVVAKTLEYVKLISHDPDGTFLVRHIDGHEASYPWSELIDFCL